MTIRDEFLQFSAGKLKQLAERIEVCLGQLNAGQIWMRGAEHQNAIGNLVLHLNGNVRQWILTGIGGAPDDRVRDAEFAARGGVEPTELKQRLRTTVEAAAKLIESLPEARLLETVRIQGHDVTVLEAIYHVVEHFAGHAFQIFFITKVLTGEQLDFYSYLSDPQSAAGKMP